MSKIVKKMKIMQPGGTLSDYVPIGAEAENINVDGESVETKLGKKPYYYDTVADMKADTKLKAGDMAVTLGYYSVNDGGAAEYNIIDDNGYDSDYYEELNNNLLAKLIIEDVINIKQLGAKEKDGTFDNSLIIKKAIKYAGEVKKVSTIFIPSGFYYCLTTIDFENDSSKFNGINIIGAGQNYTGNMAGTVITFNGTDDSYFIKAGLIARCNFKDFKIVGTNRNNCLSSLRVSVSNFENIEFAGFINSVWIKNQCAYVNFTRCIFDNSRDNAKGVIINQHYTDGRGYTGDTNTEYIYFNECAMDGAFHECTHLQVYGGIFITIDKCDLCNTTGTALDFDSSGWGGILDDIIIKSTSFTNNKINTHIKTGSGECARISIDGHYLRGASVATNDDRILIAEGNSSSRIYFIDLTGSIESYATATYSMEVEYTTGLHYNFNGELSPIRNTNSTVEKVQLYKYGQAPYYQVVTPQVTVNGNTITYDFTSIVEHSDCLYINILGRIGGASNSCYANVKVAQAFGTKIVTNQVTNATVSASGSRQITFDCGSLTPTTDISNMLFTITKY